MADLSELSPPPGPVPPPVPVPPPGAAVRLGYHGSAQVVSRIVRLAGWDETTMEISEYDIRDPFHGLRRGELDLIVAKFGLAEPDLATSRTLTEDARAVLVAEGHPLAARPSVSCEDLADHEAFAPPDGFPAYIWDAVVPPRTPSGRTVRRGHRVRSVPDMMRLVAEGRAVHVSLISLADLAPPGIRVVPIHDLPPAPVTVAWRRDTERPAHIREFVAAAEAGAAAAGALREAGPVR